TKHFPEMRDGEVHDDGEMWSSALFRARALVGADVMDSLVLESHFLLSTGESFGSAAAAILAADGNLYGGAHRVAVGRALVWQGLSRQLSPPASFDTVVEGIPVTIENPRTGGQYDNLLDDLQSFTEPGAAALRLHFAQIGTETDATCLDGGCDNIYLYDG